MPRRQHGLTFEFGVDAGHDAEQGALSRTVQTQNADLGAVEIGKVDPLEHRLFVVVPADADHRIDHLWGYPFNRSYHMFSMAYPRAGKHYPGSVGEFQAWFRTDADCLDYLEWAAVARRLRLSELRPRRRLALGRWPLHVSGVFDTQFGDGRYDLRSDADTLDDMVHRLLAVRHR